MYVYDPMGTNVSVYAYKGSPCILIKKQIELKQLTSKAIIQNISISYLCQKIAYIGQDHQSFLYLSVIH